MKKRSPAAVFLLPFITFGIYSIYWAVSTKTELNKQGAKIPTAWLLIIPLVNLWWLWKYSEAVGDVTKEKVSGVLAFLLLFLLGCIGQAIIQTYYNKLDAQPVAASPAQPEAAPVDAPAPAVPATTPTPVSAPTSTPVATSSTDGEVKPPATLVQ